MLQVRDPWLIKCVSPLISSCRRYLRAGGTIELAECRTHMLCDDGTFPEDCYTAQWVVSILPTARVLSLWLTLTVSGRIQQDFAWQWHGV